VNDLDDISNDSHNNESNSYRLRYLDELSLVGLGTTVNKQSTVFQELSWDLGDLSELVGHRGSGIRVEGNEWGLCL